VPSYQPLTGDFLAVKTGRVTKAKAAAKPKIKAEPLAEEGDEDMLMDNFGADLGAAGVGGEAGDEFGDFM
jgi:hypothetical protein